MFQGIQTVCPLSSFQLEPIPGENSSPPLLPSDLSLLFQTLTSPTMEELSRPFTQHMQAWFEHVDSQTPHILDHLQRMILTCDPASRDIPPWLIQAIQEIGLKLPQQVVLKAESAHSTLQELFREIAWHNRFAYIPERVQASRVYKICKVYEEVASPLRNQWEQNFPHPHRWMLLPTKSGLLHFYPYVPIQNGYCAEGVSKGVTSAWQYKPDPITQNISAKIKQQVAMARPLQIEETLFPEKEEDLSLHLKALNISGFITGKAGRLFWSKETRRILQLPSSDPSKTGRAYEHPAKDLVMKFASGGSLFRYLVKNGRSLSPNDRLLLSLDIAKAIANLHKAGYVYNDLKTANILIFQKTGERPIAHIGDLESIRKRGYLSSILSSLPTPEQYEQIVEYLPVESSQEAAMFALGDIFAAIQGLPSPMEELRLTYCFIELDKALPKQSFYPSAQVIATTKNRYSQLQARSQTPAMQNSPDPFLRILSHLFLLDPRARWTAEQLVQYLSQQIGQPSTCLSNTST